jgi:hypothetical protein
MHLVSSKVSRLTIYECKSLQKKIQDQRATGRSSGALSLGIAPRRMGSERGCSKSCQRNFYEVLKFFFNIFSKKFTLKNFVDRIV